MHKATALSNPYSRPHPVFPVPLNPKPGPCGVACIPQLLLIAKADDLKADAALAKAYRASSAAQKGKLVFVTVNVVG